MRRAPRRQFARRARAVRSLYPAPRAHSPHRVPDLARLRGSGFPERVGRSPVARRCGRNPDTAPHWVRPYDARSWPNAHRGHRCGARLARRVHATHRDDFPIGAGQSRRHENHAPVRCSPIVVAVAVIASAACRSPEASRSRGGGSGADVRNRDPVVEMHAGSRMYNRTPCLLPNDKCTGPKPASGLPGDFPQR